MPDIYVYIYIYMCTYVWMYVYISIYLSLSIYLIYIYIYLFLFLFDVIRLFVLLRVWGHSGHFHVMTSSLKASPSVLRKTVGQSVAAIASPAAALLAAGKAISARRGAVKRRAAATVPPPCFLQDMNPKRREKLSLFPVMTVDAAAEGQREGGPEEVWSSDQHQQRGWILSYPVIVPRQTPERRETDAKQICELHETSCNLHHQREGVCGTLADFRFAV